MSDWHWQGLAQTCRQLKSGELTAVKLTDHMLQRIAALDPQLKSYARLMPEAALEQAASLDRKRQAGEPLGPLHGVPVAVKDLLNTAGVVTASGTVVMADFVPETDATVVTRLRDAGAVLIGKTQLTEGAFGSHHPDIPAPVNPWHADYWSGVSSSGSGVSVAAGLTFAALGTDTGGSIRFPSACCGLVGIKPTYGRVSRHGAFPLAASLDHIGPMTRSVEDAARVLTVIAGLDPLDDSSLNAPVPNYANQLGQGLLGTRVGIDWQFVSDGVADEVVAMIRTIADQLADLGAQIIEITMPPEHRRLADEWGISCGVECAQAHVDYYPQHQAQYGPNLAGLIELGRAVPDERYQELELLRGRFRDGLNAGFNAVDLLLAPCMPITTPTAAAIEQAVAEEDERAALIAFTAPFDYSGHPTITLPAGLDANGLPQGFQLIGPWLAEASLVRAAYAYEQSLGGFQFPNV